MDVRTHSRLASVVIGVWQNTDINNGDNIAQNFELQRRGWVCLIPRLVQFHANPDCTNVLARSYSLSSTRTVDASFREDTGLVVAYSLLSMARVKRASVKSVAPKKKKPGQNSTEAPKRVSRKSIKDGQAKKTEGGGSGRCAEHPRAPGEGVLQARESFTAWLPSAGGSNLAQRH